MSKSPFSRGLNVKKSIFKRAIFKSGRFTRACKRRVATLDMAKNSDKRDGGKGLVMEVSGDPGQGQDLVEVNG